MASPDTLVIVHMVCIGWLSMAMCGALFQFVPVLVAKPLFAERWVFPAFALLTIGLLVLIAGFLSLGGKLTSWPWLLPAGATLLLAGFAVAAADLGLTIWRAGNPAGPARFVLVGLASLCATAAFGATFAFVLTGWSGYSGPMLLTGVPLHAIAGLGGWLTLTAMGVSYRLLSMFMLAPEVDKRQCRQTLMAGAAAIAIVVVGGLLAIALSGGLQVVLGAAALMGLLTLGLYGRDVAALYRSRGRTALELNTRMAGWSYASLAVTAFLAIALVATETFEAQVGAFAFLAVFGWLSGLVLAKLYKIVAFLTWLETYGPVMGRTPTPRVQDLVAESRATKWFAIYFLSVWSATGLLLAGQPSAFRFAALAMMFATSGIVHELIRIRRLSQVSPPLRLPAGAAAPRLLFARN